MIKKYAFILYPLVCLAVGGAAGYLIRGSVKEVFPLLEKPPFTPLAWVFPIVWTVLYILMGIGMARVKRIGGAGARRAGWIWGIQLVMNFGWSLLFFNGGQYMAAFLWLAVLWLMILAMALSFGRVSGTAGKLQIPYLVWTAFAGYLNLGIWILN